MTVVKASEVTSKEARLPCGCIGGTKSSDSQEKPVFLINRGCGDERAAHRTGGKRWTPSTGQLIDVAKWNLLRYIPVKMRGAEDDTEETAKPFASL